MALLLTGFLKNHMAAMEEAQNYMIPALKYLVRISMGPNEEPASWQLAQLAQLAKWSS